MQFSILFTFAGIAVPNISGTERRQTPTRSPRWTHPVLRAEEAWIGTTGRRGRTCTSRPRRLNTRGRTTTTITITRAVGARIPWPTGRHASRACATGPSWSSTTCTIRGRRRRRWTTTRNRPGITITITITRAGRPTDIDGGRELQYNYYGRDFDVANDLYCSMIINNITAAAADVARSYYIYTHKVKR